MQQCEMSTKPPVDLTAMSSIVSTHRGLRQLRFSLAAVELTPMHRSNMILHLSDEHRPKLHLATLRDEDKHAIAAVIEAHGPATCALVQGDEQAMARLIHMRHPRQIQGESAQHKHAYRAEQQRKEGSMRRT